MCVCMRVCRYMRLLSWDAAPGLLLSLYPHQVCACVCACMQRALSLRDDTCACVSVCVTHTARRYPLDDGSRAAPAPCCLYAHWPHPHTQGRSITAQQSPTPRQPHTTQATHPSPYTPIHTAGAQPSSLPSPTPNKPHTTHSPSCHATGAQPRYLVNSYTGQHRRWV
jgi:hypothetical protein